MPPPPDQATFISGGGIVVAVVIGLFIVCSGSYLGYLAYMKIRNRYERKSKEASKYNVWTPARFDEKSIEYRSKKPTNRPVEKPAGGGVKKETLRHGSIKVDIARSDKYKRLSFDSSIDDTTYLYSVKSSFSSVSSSDIHEITLKPKTRREPLQGNTRARPYDPLSLNGPLPATPNFSNPFGPSPPTPAAIPNPVQTDFSHLHRRSLEPSSPLLPLSPITPITPQPPSTASPRPHQRARLSKPSRLTLPARSWYNPHPTSPLTGRPLSPTSSSALLMTFASAQGRRPSDVSPGLDPEYLYPMTPAQIGDGRPLLQLGRSPRSHERSKSMN